MKKIIIYVLLSVILVVPIATILSVAIMSTRENEYISVDFTNDLSGLETGVISFENLEEVISAKGKFISDLEKINISVRDFDTLFLPVEAGDYLFAGDMLCRVDGKDVICEKDLFVEKIVQGASSLLFYVRSLNAGKIVVSLPINSYDYSSESKLSFSYGEKAYNDIACVFRYPFADENSDTYQALYSIEDGNFVFGGSVEVKIKTGFSVENAVVVPKNCIFQDENGNYYIQLVEKNEIIDIPVSLGVFGMETVQIIADEVYGISSGKKIVTNNKDVFSQQTSKTESEKTDK